jgi:hypothetical protein
MLGLIGKLFFSDLMDEQDNQDDEIIAPHANPQNLWVDTSGDRPMYSGKGDRHGNPIWYSDRNQAIRDLNSRRHD